MLLEVGIAELLAITGVFGLCLGACGIVLWCRGMRFKRSTIGLLRELAETRNRLKMMQRIVSNARDGLVIQDLDGRIEWSNPAYSRITGYAAEEILGRRPQEFILPPDAMLPADELNQYSYDTESGILNDLEIVKNIRKDGEVFWNQLSFAVVDSDDIKDKKVMVFCRDVTEQILKEQRLKDARREVEFQAEHDFLTNLPNRKKLTDYLEGALNNAKSNGGVVGLLLVDLDRFKIINDTMGHAAGDAVLVRTAELLGQIFDGIGLVSRAGGDEFTVVCPNVTGIAEMEKLGQEVLDAMAAPLMWQSQQISFGASIGAAVSKNGKIAARRLIQNADVALYDVKNADRGGVACYNDAIAAEFEAKEETRIALSGALENGELSVVFQPQFFLETGAVSGFEALVRWKHPTEGILAPDKFLEIADRAGLIVQVDHEATRASLDGLKRIHEAGNPDLTISLNVSATTLRQGNFAEILKWEADLRNIPHSCIAVEIVETTLFQSSVDEIGDAVRDLSNAGFLVQMDDFGTGSGSFCHLGRMDFDAVKIDKTMIGGLASNPIDQKIVHAIIDLCHELNIGIISEGVENREQVEILRQMGCSIVQGYGLARPFNVTETLNFLACGDIPWILDEHKGTSTIRIGSRIA